jgi:hypothetical protein
VASELVEAHAYRTERLQLLGNGVVPLTAGFAFCVLAKELGLIDD